MAQSTTFLRFASPNERRTISRQDVGFYNALVIGAVYEFTNKEIDIKSIQSFIQPLKLCIQDHPFLSVVVRNAHTEKPFFERVSNINIEDHISIITDEKGNGGIATIERVLPLILDRPWPAGTPPWRIVVLPLPSQGIRSSCFIAFAFSHTLGDGMCGLAFHRTLLDAWQHGVRMDEEKQSSTINSTNRTLSEPFDTPARLPISWAFLLAPLIAVYLPKFVADFLGLRAAVGTIDAGTWTGSPVFSAPEGIQSRVKLLEIEAPLVQKALQTSRDHHAKLTAVLHQLIVRALSKALPDNAVTNFCSLTAVDMRGSIGTPGYTWGLFVSSYNEMHPRLIDLAGPVMSDQRWAAASSMTENLAACATRLQDQAIGLLRYAPSIRNWTLGKVGSRRDGSYELSNLLVFDGEGGGNSESKKCKITKMVFAQPGNVPSAPLVFNIVSAKGGSLVCAVTWQAGALGVPAEEEESLVNEICSSLRTDFVALCEAA